MAPGQTECDPAHEHHIGNAAADAAADKGVQAPIPTNDSPLRGEDAWYMTHNDTECTGDIKATLHTAMVQALTGYMATAESARARAWADMRRQADPTMWRHAQTTSAGGTPRFKTRLWVDALPTYKNMRHWHHDDDTNEAAAMWRTLVQEEGNCCQCMCEGDTHQESRAHIFQHCPHTQPLREDMHYTIAHLWDEAGLLTIWNHIDWTLPSGVPATWKVEWSHLGAVPSTVLTLVHTTYTTPVAREAIGLSLIHI